MVKRKKRLEKGIKSIEEQIRLHEIKREEATEKGKAELVGYYDGELSRLKNVKEKKRKQMEKQ